MQRTLALSAAALFLAGIALSEDFWVTKDYMQWNDEEVKKLMTNSPWAKDVTISASPAVLGSAAQRSASDASPADTESPGGGGGGRGRGRGGGAGATTSGGATQMLLTMNLSWRSALPFRKALVRSRVGAGALVPIEGQRLIESNQEDYVIVVSGVPARMAGTIQNPDELGKSVLKLGKKPPIPLKGFDIQPRTQTVDVIFVFPRTQPIVPDDKEVEAVLQLGQIELKKKFNLKEMVYNGKLEL